MVLKELTFLNKFLPIFFIIVFRNMFKNQSLIHPVENIGPLNEEKVF